MHLHTQAYRHLDLLNKIYALLRAKNKRLWKVLAKVLGGGQPFTDEKVFSFHDLVPLRYFRQHRSTPFGCVQYDSSSRRRPDRLHLGGCGMLEDGRLQISLHANEYRQLASTQTTQTLEEPLELTIFPATQHVFTKQQSEDTIYGSGDIQGCKTTACVSCGVLWRLLLF